MRMILSRILGGHVHSDFFLIGITMTLPDEHKRIEPSRSHVLQVLLKKEGTPDLSGVPSVSGSDDLD